MTRPLLKISFVVLLILTCDSCKTTRPNKYNKDLLRFTLNWQGVERNYLVHLPPAAKQTRPMPVLFHLHGGGGTAEGTPGLTFGRFNDLANRDGWIVVYPNAVDKNWNDGRKASFKTVEQQNIDDVGFITAIIDKITANYSIDQSRIFCTGMSNGGFMTSKLLCDRAELFRGGAILTASISADYFPLCKPSRPVAVMIMNGTADPLVPYNGGQIKVFRKNRGEIISTNDYVHFWQKENRCTNKTSRKLPDTQQDGTTVIVETYSDCATRGALSLYTIHGGGHTWPGGKQYLGERIIGKTCRDFNACDVIWDYFQQL